MGNSDLGAVPVPPSKGTAGVTSPTRWQAANKVPTAPRASPTNRLRETATGSTSAEASFGILIS